MDKVDKATNLMPDSLIPAPEPYISIRYASHTTQFSDSFISVRFMHLTTTTTKMCYMKEFRNHNTQFFWGGEREKANAADRMVEKIHF
jgi:hypothetical protein